MSHNCPISAATHNTSWIAEDVYARHIWEAAARAALSPDLPLALNSSTPRGSDIMLVPFAAMGV